MDFKCDSGEVCSGNEEDITGNWRKENSCYKVAMNLADLYSCVLWKVELMGDEMRLFS